MQENSYFNHSIDRPLFIYLEFALTDVASWAVLALMDTNNKRLMLWK